jgi:hypothetical protein
MALPRRGSADHQTHRGRVIHPRHGSRGTAGARARVAVIPPHVQTAVHGLAFASNRVLHSGVDREPGHFIAAYGFETAERVGAG